jgi:hypothetical protein
MTTRATQIDGNALIRALRYAPKNFHKLRHELIKSGASDASIVRAMAGATEIIDSIGSRPVKAPKPKYGKR